MYKTHQLILPTLRLSVLGLCNGMITKLCSLLERGVWNSWGNRWRITGVVGADESWYLTGELLNSSSEIQCWNKIGVCKRGHTSLGQGCVSPKVVNILLLSPLGTVPVATSPTHSTAHVLMTQTRGAALVALDTRVCINVVPSSRKERHRLPSEFQRVSPSDRWAGGWDCLASPRLVLLLHAFDQWWDDAWIFPVWEHEWERVPTYHFSKYKLGSLHEDEMFIISD